MTTLQHINTKIESLVVADAISAGDDWSFLLILPPEVTVLIFSYVPLLDLGHLAVTCKILNNFLDTNDIWKQIFELKFGVIREDSVNLAQEFNWKLTVVDATYLMKWRKDFVHSSITHKFTFSYFGTDDTTSFITPDGLHQVFFARNYILAVVDLKMAGKFVPVKINPMKLYSGLTYSSAGAASNFKSQLIKHHSFIAPKKGEYAIPETKLASCCFSEASNGRGDFLINVENHHAGPLVLWRAEVHGMVHHNSTPPILCFSAPDGTRASSWQFNKNYIMHLDMDTGGVFIMDLSKQCLHCNPASNTGSRYECEMKNCEKGCAIVHNSSGYKFIFASQLNPDIMIGLAPMPNSSDFQLTIWNKGDIQATIPFKGLHGLTWQTLNLTEHITERDGVKRHWFGNYCVDQSIFMDLNDLSLNPILLPGCKVLAWVPNESKIALGVEGKVTIYDLEARAWCSVMKFGRMAIHDLTFSKKGQVLFVTTSTIHACYWKTAWIIETFGLGIAGLSTQFVMDQLLVLSTSTKSTYRKLRSKLEI